MAYLAHRGWTCHAINLRGHGDAGGRQHIATLRIADYLSDVERVIALCEAAPIVVGHDLGGLLALACSPAAAPAVVALAPLVPRAIGGAPHPVLGGWRVRLASWQLRPLPPPRGAVGAEYFARAAPGGVAADSPQVAHELNDETFELQASGGRPTLVMAGDGDKFCPPHSVERLARHVGAQFHTMEGAQHAMPWEVGWERCAAATHRWVIRALGEPLLLFRGAEDE
jgi:pimeloyl-ACP methyl ester carboxylesterase